MLITEEQYELLRPHLPIQRGNVRIANIDLINALLYVAENGCRWRALPERYGNWHTVCMRLRRWAEKGGLECLFKRMQEHQLIRMRVECLGLYSTSVKVHRTAACGVKKRPRRGVALAGRGAD